jgi:hypothetical protein
VSVRGGTGRVIFPQIEIARGIEGYNEIAYLARAQSGQELPIAVNKVRIYNRTGQAWCHSHRLLKFQVRPGLTVFFNRNRRCHLPSFIRRLPRLFRAKRRRLLGLSLDRRRDYTEKEYG